MINYYPWAVYCEGPPSFIWGEGGAKNEGLLSQSTIDIHILNIFQLTVDIHFQNTLLLPLSLLLCSLLLPNCEGSHSVRLFLWWHMPADTTETVAEHSARLQPSINLLAPVTTFMFSCPVLMESQQNPFKKDYIATSGHVVMLQSDLMRICLWGLWAS